MSKPPLQGPSSTPVCPSPYVWEGLASQEAACVSNREPPLNSQNISLQGNQLQLQLQLIQLRLIQQRHLRAVERKIRATLDLSTICGTTVVEVASLFRADQVALIEFDQATGICRQIVRYCQNQSLAWQLPLTFSQADFPSLLELLWKGQLIYLSKADELMRSHPTLAHNISRWKARWQGNWLLLPIRKSVPQTARPASQNWGVLALSLPNDQEWSKAAIADARSLTIELSAAMSHSSQYQELLTTNEELQKLALSDGLTSLANRRRFDKHVADEWQRLAREQQPLSLILCDIDHFKLYNDAFGHPAGDRCLIHIARALLQVPQRPADLVARYGGEEFAIILPNTDTQGAWRVAQNIHESIRDLHIRHAPSSAAPCVTVTMGVSTIIPGHNNTTQMLLQASDIALYYAKQQGRNRTYVNGHYNTVNHTDIAPKAEAATDSKLKLTPNN
ncbi:MAG: diguanylate cyclase [Phormidesmis sp.]